MKNCHLAWAIVMMLSMTSGGVWCDEKSAVAALEKYVFGFTRDESQPGKPVIDVRISGCFLDDELLRELPALKQLKSLTIITPGENVDAALKGLNDMKKLQMLNLRGCDLTDFSVNQISMVTGLRTLDIRLTTMTDARLKQLGSLKQLQKLYVNNESVTDSGMKEITRLKQLQTLDLRGTSVGNIGLKELAKLRGLQYLELCQTKVTDEGLKDLAALTELQRLGLNSTAVTDAGLKHLVPLKNLQLLNLCDTKVTVTGVAALKKASPACQISHGALVQ